jgi:hypothetical protein
VLIPPGRSLTLASTLMELQQLSDTESRAIKAQSIDPQVFSLPLAPAALSVPAAPIPLAPAHALPLDLVTLSSAQPPVLTRLAVFANPWPSAEAIWSSSDGVNYSVIAVAAAPATIGATLDDLPAGPTARWHNATFRVALYGGALASVSDSAVLAGANAAALQRADGAWEVIQFANAELVGDRTYSLSRLLRGQAGSEWAMGAPLTAGAPFVLLNAQVLTIASGLDALERPLQLRVVATGRDIGDPSVLTLTTTPQTTALRPLSPVHVKASRDTSGVTFSWIRRTRVDGDSWVGEVPLGEDSERYTLDILSGSDVMRTLTVKTSTALYTAADELADFGATQASLSIRVTQLSATVGVGFPTTVTLIP